MKHLFSDEQKSGKTTPFPAAGAYLNHVKRCLDVFVVCAISPLILPVCTAAMMMALLFYGSALEGQERIGQSGKSFRRWKINTTPGGSRIPGRLGRFLRAFSLDELPQFWNILRGDMSLLGPKALAPFQRRRYDNAAPVGIYYTLRPGISGLWQARSRNVGGFLDRISYDQEYAGKVSFKYDLKLLYETVQVVLKANGK